MLVKNRFNGKEIGDFDISPKANLGRANLREADLREANLREANLREANLGEADLSGADLSGANLSGTCIDPQTTKLWRKFYKVNPPKFTGGHIVYRTFSSKYIDSTIYEPGKTYVAPVLSWDTTTNCHPGIYAFATKEELLKNYPDEDNYSIGYIRRGEFTVTPKDECVIRCKRYRALLTVTKDELIAYEPPGGIYRQNRNGGESWE